MFVVSGVSGSPRWLRVCDGGQRLCDAKFYEVYIKLSSSFFSFFSFLYQITTLSSILTCFSDRTLSRVNPIPTSLQGVPRTRVRSSPGPGSARVRSTLLAARESWRGPLLRGRLCCAPSATSHRTRENIYRCSRYTASGNKSIVFIFKWRVSDFCLVVSKEKGSVQRHPDSSGLESTRVRGCLEPAREQHYKYRTKATRKVRIN